MNRKSLPPFFLFLACFLIAMLLCVWINNSYQTLRSGEGLPEGYDGQIITLAGFESDAQGLYFILHGQGETPQLSVLTAMLAPGNIYFGAVQADITGNTSLNGHLCAYDIPAECFSYEGAGWTLRLDFLDSAPNLSFINFCAPEHAKNYITTFSIILPSIYGLLLFASLYGFSLYFSKRGEVYLLLFALSTLMLFLWCISAAILFNYGVAYGLLQFCFDYSYEFAIVLSVATCFSFCEVKLKKPLRWLGSWYGLLFLCLLFAFVSHFLPSLTKEIVRFAVYMVGCVVLIATCAKAPQKPWLPLCGLGISQGMRMVALLPDIGSFHVTIFIITIKMLRMFLLPFVLSCMLYINRKFADKFSEAQTLAAALESVNRDLDQKVEERTRQIIDQQQIRSHLIANIFHDLRTPLFILRGCIDAIKEKQSYDAENLEIVDDRLSFITALTEDLFLVAKLEDKTLLMETEPVRVRPLLAATVEACRVQAQQKGVGIRMEAAEDAWAWGDESWLGRAFQNLIVNAVYYTPMHGEDVLVRMDLESNSIRIEVRDHGVGIAAEDMGKIFQRYYRVSGQSKHQSSGLGLSIVQGVVVQHNGGVDVESRIGEGTAFTVRLPLWRRSES